METALRHRLSDAEKDALSLEQAALIERLAARITALEALVGKPRKTSSNSHTPPPQDGPGRPGSKAAKRRRKPWPSRPGVSRRLSEELDKTERWLAESCPHCGMTVSAPPQRCRQRYDHINLPVIRPVVTQVELFGGRCGDCGRRCRAEPAGLPSPQAITSASSGCRGC